MKLKTFRFIPIVLLLVAPGAYSQKFYPDDPLWEDKDRRPIPAIEEVEISQIFDFAYNTFKRKDNPPVPAENVNTLGEVPDSSWFTNRIGKSKMTVDELVRGPNQGSGPDVSGPWTITRAKTQGITPGFTIKDSKGDTYFIKFDPITNPQMATSAEVISTKFFHAFGYNVPENYLATLKPELLQISPDARLTDEDGIRRPMRQDDVDEILKRVPRTPDGSIQVIASLGLEGKPLGPFQYRGTRSDDANDIFFHENRRELRGMRVFSSWLNHDDSRSINSLDMFISDGDQGYVRHNLIDFGSTLGSGSVRAQKQRAGNEYMIEWGPITKAGVTLGLWDRPWRKIKYPDYPAIGRFESSYFRPEKWRPEYPNAAFDQMDFKDALWATRIVMRFDDEAVRAIVKTGNIADPEAEEYLFKCLVERRDKIIRYYLNQINPLYDFTVAGRDLTFVHLGKEAGLSSTENYEIQWNVFDNQAQQASPLGEMQLMSSASIQIPANDSPFLMASIKTIDPEHENWKGAVRVYIRNGSSPSVVGIERD